MPRGHSFGIYRPAPGVSNLPTSSKEKNRVGDQSGGRILSVVLYVGDGWPRVRLSNKYDQGLQPMFLANGPLDHNIKSHCESYIG